MKGNQKTLHRQIRSQFQGKRHIPFVATDHEIGHGRNITWALRAKQAPEHIREAWIGTSWIMEVTASGIRDGKHFQAIHLFLTSLRTTPEALLQLVRDRWSIEGWHWIRDTQLHEDAHRYRGNGAGDVTPFAAPVPMRAGGLVRPLSIAGGLPGAYAPGEPNAVCRRCTRFGAAPPTPWPLVKMRRARCSGTRP